MQSEDPKIHLLYKNISNIIKTIFECFIKRNYLLNTALENVDFKNPANYLQIEDIYLGANVQKTISEIRLSPDQLQFFWLRCLDFYIEACSQIIRRFSLKNNPIKKFEMLDPAIVKLGTIQSITDVAILFPNIVNSSDLQALDTEWRILRNCKEIESFPNEAVGFWQEVQKMKLGDDSSAFKILSNFTFSILSLPQSSANVERIFSDINLTKTKQRNKLNNATISGLLHTRSYIRHNNCYDFKIEKNHLTAISSRSLYDT